MDVTNVVPAVGSVQVGSDPFDCGPHGLEDLGEAELLTLVQDPSSAPARWPNGSDQPDARMTSGTSTDGPSADRQPARSASGPVSR